MTPGTGIILVTAGATIAILPFLNRASERVRAFISWVFVALRLRYAWWQIGCCLAALAEGWVWFPVWAFVAWETWLTSLSVREWRRWARSRCRSADADVHQDWYLTDGGKAPLVDVLIPTFNEQKEIIERCITCALALDYPNFRVWVLDDGRRNWLKEYAAARGVHYLSRANNAFFKAGNLNNALRHITASSQASEFVAVLDCDFVPMPEFLRRTLALMHDRSVGIVQTPQAFYNADIFQYAFGAERCLPDTLRFQYDFQFPTRDARDLMTCCGTSCLLRLSAMQAIGFFPTETLSEDTLASLAMRQHGYNTAYLSEHLSYGMAAEGLQEFLKQQARWCLGTVQNIYTKYGALRPGPKSLREVWWGLEEALCWGLFVTVQWIYIGIGIGLWFVPDLLPMAGVTPDGFVSNFFPMWLFGLVSINWMTNHNRIPFFTEAASLISAFVIVPATWRGLSRSRNFRFEVTDKGAVRSRVYVHWRVMWWLVLAAVLTIIATVHGLTRHAPPQVMAMNPVLLFWTCHNLLMLLVGIGVCVELPQRRREERFSCEIAFALTVEGGQEPAVLLDLSTAGARVRTERRLRVGDALRVPLLECGDLDARVVRVGASDYGVQWDIDDDQRIPLIRHVYSRRYIRPVLVGRPLDVIKAALRRAFA